jgi:alpha/beta superfamily hydrolase
MAVVRAALATDMSALTFNFRGVGASTGAFDGGIGERDDATAALAYARSMAEVERTVLAGYSFGAGVAAAVVDDSLAGLCLVSVSANALGAESAFRRYRGPSLLLSGDQDHVSSVPAIQVAAGEAAGQVETTIVPGVDHFWWGHEGVLADTVQTFLEKLR